MKTEECWTEAIIIDCAALFVYERFVNYFQHGKIFKLTTEPCKHVALSLNNCGRALGRELIISKICEKFIKSHYGFALSSRSWRNIFRVKLISNHLFPKVWAIFGMSLKCTKRIQSRELQKVSHPSWTMRRRMRINRSRPCGHNSITHNPVRPLYRLHLTN